MKVLRSRGYKRRRSFADDAHCPLCGEVIAEAAHAWIFGPFVGKEKGTS
jgi:hypothetical protein